MITKKDLIGDLKGFPIEVVEKMIEKQVEQGNKPDVTVFQRRSTFDKHERGFTWRDTSEGDIFWDHVIIARHFKVFFEKYPSKKVYIRGNKKRGAEVIAELEKRGGINRFGVRGALEDCLYFIRPDNGFIYCWNSDGLYGHFLQEVYTEITLPDAPLELTLKEIAEKFGVSTVKIVE